MKSSVILRRAASLLERPSYGSVGACYAVNLVSTTGRDQYCAMKWLKFVANKAARKIYWFGNPGIDGQGHRILALCFAADLAEDEND